ncbi:hypothetical protein NOVO_07800 [Rickettsiales bacterium Ac37b]|nr:hypothetical protein NOVO_07800 [Rickettsiales bacterium Ac37b]
MIEVITPKSNIFKIHDQYKEFPYYVGSAIIMVDRIIVAYDPDEIKESIPNFDYNRSIWCYDLEGNILWYVEKPYYIDKETGAKVIYDKPVDSLAYNTKTKQIYAFSYRGYVLDTNTGKLSDDFEIR